jgi:uncharacterized protein YdeI (YjbR/CyaY-like superfamily)
MRFRTSIELGGKTATGFRVPDEVVATLASGLDDCPIALDAEPEARRTFDGLSNSNRKWHVLQVTGAKTGETRQRRIEKSVAMLRAGRAR